MNTSFLAADAENSKLLLSKGGGQEVFLYDTATQTATLLPGARMGVVSADLSTIYFSAPGGLTPEAPEVEQLAGREPVGDVYRYDISTKSLRFAMQGHVGSVSPDGRYLYSIAEGVPGVFLPPKGGLQGDGPDRQLFRYDSVENTIECISCASPFDSTPHLEVAIPPVDEDIPHVANVAPQPAFASGNGDYAFFDTASDLVPQDIDGEVPNCSLGDNACGPGLELGNHDGALTVSSDVYEWRRNGIGGCGHVQGCLALITSGTGGLKNELIGTADEGRDVFFTTHSQLVAQDNDAQGDVYDARIGGGFPAPAPRPVECEGDACSTPASAPIDATPSSFTFAGAGNILQIPASKAVVKAKQSKPKKRRKKKDQRGRRKAGRASRARGRVGKSAGRSKR